MAKLEAVTPGGQTPERGGEALVVAVKPLRQLPEHRAELRGFYERLDPLVEALDPLLHVLEVLHVREKATRLDGKEETRRGFLHPVRHRRARRQTVEGVVDLDCVEKSSVVFEPTASRQTLRINRLPPMRVVPARAADPNRLRVGSVTKSRHKTLLEPQKLRK